LNQPKKKEKQATTKTIHKTTDANKQNNKQTQQNTKQTQTTHSWVFACFETVHRHQGRAARENLRCAVCRRAHLHDPEWIPRMGDCHAEHHTELDGLGGSSLLFVDLLVQEAEPEVSLQSKSCRRYLTTLFALATIADVVVADCLLASLLSLHSSLYHRR
jgi:hypothetical protein